MPATDRDLWEDDPDADPPLGPLWEDDPDDADLTRPVWEDLIDETAAPPRPRPSRAAGLERGSAETLLAPLAAAQDALARLDARANTAPAPVGDGLIARLALREAAGWLASQGAWVHPRDLALRAENLAGRFDTAAQIARPRAALPSTFLAAPGTWDDPEDLVALAQAEAKAVRALALARLLTALPRQHDPFAAPDVAARLLGPLGAGTLDPDRFSAWRDVLPSERGRGEKPGTVRPPLLQAASAALAWMESGITEEPDALVALAITAVRLARNENLRRVPLPFWAAWPALGHPTEDGLPRLRPAIARDISGGDRAPWLVGFLTFAAEAARAGSRELDRLLAAAEAGQRLAQELDQRSRLPAAVEVVLASPVVTPRGLAGTLGITVQAANRLLGRLAAGGVVREVTGRGSFRAFAV